MGYVTSSLPSGTVRGLKVAMCDDFTGGVCFAQTKSSDGYDKSPYMCNMIDRGGVLGTRDGQTKLFSSQSFSGEVYGLFAKEFFGNAIVHIGTNLYAINSSGETCRVLSTQMPQSKSIMVLFSSKLYIYCDYRIFSVDMNLTFSEEVPFAPHKYELMGTTSHSGPDKKCNLVAPVIKVTIGVSDTQYRLPIEADLSKPFRVYYGDSLLDEDCYIVTNNKVGIIGLSLYDDLSKFSIIYYVANREYIGYDDVFSTLTLAESFGGETISGTRVLMTGSEKYPGRIYMSSLLDPLRFDVDSYETVGNSCDNITGFIKQYGRLIIFTKNNVMRMTYSFSQDISSFTVKELNSQIGCDMPGSIQLIDNRVVFGNSKKGIFIIDSTEDFGEQNIKPISENINKGNEVSFLECTQEEKQKACSIDFDRKYYLCVGEKMYVWDYGKAGYSDSGNYSKAQKKLIWYFFDGIKADFLFNCEEKLVALYVSESENFFSVFENTGLDFGKPFYSCLKTTLLNLSYAMHLKSTEKIDVFLKCDKAGNVNIFSYDENGEFYKKSFCVDEKLYDVYPLTVYLPKKSVMKFSFSVESKEIPFSIDGASIYYKLSDRKH